MTSSGVNFTSFAARQRKIGLYRGRIFEQSELKLIVVVRKETDCFDKTPL